MKIQKNETEEKLISLIENFLKENNLVYNISCDIYSLENQEDGETRHLGFSFSKNGYGMSKTFNQKVSSDIFFKG